VQQVWKFERKIKYQRTQLQKIIQKQRHDNLVMCVVGGQLFATNCVKMNPMMKPEPIVNPS